MIKLTTINRRAAHLLVVLVPLLVIFIYVGLQSGPLAPIPVTVTTVESRAITPSLFGVGTVEARYTHKIGPTFAGRIKYLAVDVGDTVQAKQMLGEMEPIDLDSRVAAQNSAIKSAEATLQEAQAKRDHAKIQADRYEKLFPVHAISESDLVTRRKDLRVAEAALSATKENLARSKSDLEAMKEQRNNLRLFSPVDGIVVMRSADAGTTVLAGQTILEIINPKNLWVNARFDQNSADGLAGKLSADIALRSRRERRLGGRVLYVEPKADAVTEEMLAKVVFDNIPDPLPPLGELAEVTIALPTLPAAPVIPNAAIKRMDDQTGVWQLLGGDLRFIPVTLGLSDLNGDVQVREGLTGGEQIIVYSEKALTTHSRIHVSEKIQGMTR